MRLAWNKGFRSGALKRTVGGMLLVLWLGVLALAALPQLHTHVHADAHSPQHQCAVTTLEQGKVEFHTPVTVVAIAPQPLLLEPASTVSLSLPSVDFLLAPGRAPPVA